MRIVLIKDPILILRWIAVIRLLYRIWQSWILSTRLYLMLATRSRHWIPYLMHSGNCILIYSLKRRKLSQKGEWRFAKQKLTHVDIEQAAFTILCSTRYSIYYCPPTMNQSYRPSCKSMI